MTVLLKILAAWTLLASVAAPLLAAMCKSGSSADSSSTPNG